MKTSAFEYDRIVQSVLNEQKDSPIDILGIGDVTGEYSYLTSHKDSYVRTVRDVDTLFEKDRSVKHILEIGSFLGAVSISLNRIGHNISALDIPEFYQSSSLRTLYEKNGIRFDGINLKQNKLPYDSNTFDLVIICEVIEHLNFNPLPVLREINRILKNDGFIYIGMPNQANILNRIKLFFGQSVHNPITDFFKQLDRNDNMIVGLHWREYTLGETMEMIEKMGFETVLKYYFNEKSHGNASVLNTLKTLIKWALFIYPSFRPSQVVIGKKVKVPVCDFWMTGANS
jgi:SAM-dependent methyltransferase